MFDSNQRQHAWKQNESKTIKEGRIKYLNWNYLFFLNPKSIKKSEKQKRWKRGIACVFAGHVVLSAEWFLSCSIYIFLFCLKTSQRNRKYLLMKQRQIRKIKVTLTLLIAIPTPHSGPALQPPTSIAHIQV